MKFSSATLLALGAAAMAQDLSSLPKCGQVCISNMLAIAPSEFGCKAGDVNCYCKNVNFGYGVRDCANESCSAQDASTVIQFGVSFCEQALGGASGSISVTGITVQTGSASSGASATGGQAPPASNIVSVSPLVTTITSAGSTLVSTTGFATIHGSVTNAGSASSSANGSAASVTSSLANSAASLVSSAASAVSSIEASLSASESSVASSVASEASSRAASATGSSAVSSSTSAGGAGPMMTAAPLLGAAAMGALLLI